jgi:3'(2'), 5'-bisphosphate nucleotidase
VSAGQPVALTDAQLALALATEAGVLLLGLRDAMGFGDANALRQAGDAHSHELLMRRFASERPVDTVLSEEGVDDKARLAADRVWIVDPLDGTREYGEEGRSDWAVHVALWERDRGLTEGAVALPAAGEPLATLLYAEGSAAPAEAYEGPARVVVSRSRAPEWVSVVAEQLGGGTVPMGSAGAKIAAVVRGDAEVYLHSGGQYEWDSAAPVAVARAAGLWCSRLDGSPLAYNQDNAYLPDLVVCRADLAERVLEAVARVS